MAVMPIADMRVFMGNRFVLVGMGVPKRIICLNAFRLPVGMLMGMVRVLIAWSVEVLVFMPHLVVAMPVSMVLLQHQSDPANHQDT